MRVGVWMVQASLHALAPTPSSVSMTAATFKLNASGIRNWRLEFLALLSRSLDTQSKLDEGFKNIGRITCGMSDLQNQAFLPSYAGSSLCHQA